MSCEVEKCFYEYSWFNGSIRFLFIFVIIGRSWQGTNPTWVYSMWWKICEKNKSINAFSYWIVLKNAFDAFDQEKKGVIGTDMIGTILEMLGHQLDDDTLQEIIAEVDEDGNLNNNSIVKLIRSKHGL